jgi:hypothetical protein
MDCSVLLVNWVDAFGCPPGWEFEDEVELDASHVTSIGWKLKENDEYILLCPHKSKPNSGRTQLAGHIVIPKRQIISVTEILT